MNGKRMFAAIAAMVMLASATIVVANTAYDAETSDSPTLYTYDVRMIDNETPTVELKSNYNYYAQLGDVTVAWTISEYTNDVQSQKSEGSTATINGITVTATVEEYNNIPKMTATLEKTSDAKNANILIEAKITVKSGDNSLITVDSLKYLLRVTVEGESAIVFDSLTFTYGTNDSKELTQTEGTQHTFTDNAQYYATGLPSGLSMTKDGFVSGIALGNAGEYEANVIVEDRGIIYHGTLTIKVEKYGFELYYGTNCEDKDKIGFVSADTRTYYIQQNAEVTFKASTPGANCISVLKKDDSGLSTSLISIVSDKASLKDCISGTGSYRIYIGTIDGTTLGNSSQNITSNAITYFDVYVIGTPVGVGSDIIVGSR